MLGLSCNPEVIFLELCAPHFIFHPANNRTPPLRVSFGFQRYREPVHSIPPSITLPRGAAAKFPMVILMVDYTTLSLWILAHPIVETTVK